MLNGSETVAGEGLFMLVSPCLRGIQRLVLVLQCHPSGFNFRLELFVWINGTCGTCQTSSFGDGVHVKSSMGPKRWLERVTFWREISMSEGDSVATFGIHSHPISDCNFRL